MKNIETMDTPELVKLAQSKGYNVRGMNREQIEQLLLAEQSAPNIGPVKSEETNLRYLKLVEQVSELRQDVDALKEVIAAPRKESK